MQNFAECLQEFQRLDLEIRAIHWQASKALREFRQRRGWSLARMAQVLGVSVQYLSDMEHGRRRISARVIARWEEVTSADVSQRQPASADVDRRQSASADVG